MITAHQAYQMSKRDFEKDYSDQIDKLSDTIIKKAINGETYLHDFQFTIYTKDIPILKQFLKDNDYKILSYGVNWFRLIAESFQENIFNTTSQKLVIAFSISWEEKSKK